MTKHKILTEKEPVSSDEIAKRRDFESILKSIKKVPFYQKPIFLAGIAAGVVLVAAVTLFFVLRTNEINTNEIAATENETIKPELEVKTASITAPLPEVNFAYQIFEASNEAPTNWTSSRGSTVYIPKNALVDKNGNLLKGKVDIKYREFHDPIDFFLSGIPMTYDSGGTKYVFESAGMVEILAYQNNEEVFLHPAKKATINLMSAQEGNRYNLYEFDKSASNWVIKGKDKIKPYKNKKADDAKQIADVTMPINEQNTSPKSVAINKQEQNLKQEIRKLEEKKPEKPKKYDPKKNYIELGLDVKEFPELAAYKDVKFEVGIENKNYNPRDVSATVWEGAKLTEGETKGSYNLTLKKSKKELSYIVYPALDGADYEQAKKNYAQKFNDYKVAYEKRKTELHKLEERIKEEEKRRKQEMENAIAAVNDAGVKVQRTLQISGFGIYNCDAPWFNQQPEFVQANFKNNEGKKIKLKEFYLAERNRNAIIALKPGSDFKLNYNPKAQMAIWGITSDNKLAIVTAKDLEILAAAPREITFKMEVVKEPLQTAEDVRKYIRI